MDSSGSQLRESVPQLHTGSAHRIAALHFYLRLLGGPMLVGLLHSLLSKSRSAFRTLCFRCWHCVEFINIVQAKLPYWSPPGSPRHTGSFLSFEAPGLLKGASTRRVMRAFAHRGEPSHYQNPVGQSHGLSAMIPAEMRGSIAVLGHKLLRLSKEGSPMACVGQGVCVAL
jgi:hypothetical protein